MSNIRSVEIVLDVSRTVSRRPNSKATGIDRVETAYIEYFLEWPSPVYFLARFKKQSALFDRDGMKQILEMMAGNCEWMSADFIGRFSKREISGRIDSSLRALSITWPFLKSGIKKLGIKNGVYLNVGHGKAHPKLWSKLNGLPLKKIYMVHDVIPLDFPDFCTDLTSARYNQEFRAICSNVDYLIWNSEYTKFRSLHWLEKFNIPAPDSKTLLLGADKAAPVTRTKPDPPNFVTIGTIEPRKNHALLLDVWKELAGNSQPTMPTLHIIGRRGWMNEDVFRRLDSIRNTPSNIIEHGYISDQEISDLLRNTNGLLFPSFSEGFGFPLVDAMSADVPVVCSDIPAFKEIGNKYPIYVDPTDTPNWIAAIEELCTERGHIEFKKREKPSIITWESHFSKLSSILSSIS